MIALGVTGCIAAYKAVEVMRGLQKAGHSVQAILTRSATKFIAPLTFEALSGRSVITGMFRKNSNREILHIATAQEISLLAVVPATANILGKFAHGIADDFLSTLYLSCPVPVLLAPAMNVEMWNHPAVRENVAVLKSRGHYFVDPEPGMLACGMEGAGRLAEVDTIVGRILDLVKTGGRLSGVKVLVTAGPTVEDLDPVRYISNRSSGKMGYALAQAASRLGAEVYLVSGPTSLQAPAGVQFIGVRSAAEMKDAVIGLFPQIDIVFKAAAVADYRPSEYEPRKIKKNSVKRDLALVPTEDILAALGAVKTHQLLVGFAAETDNVVERAREKLVRKNLDLIVANDVSSGVFGADATTVHILSQDAEMVTVERQSKESVAATIVEIASSLRRRRLSQDSPSQIEQA